MQAIGNGESNESVLDTSMQKVKEFTSIAGEKLSTVNWKVGHASSQQFFRPVLPINLFQFIAFLASFLYRIMPKLAELSLRGLY